MRELTYFKLGHCPYCRQADQWLEELKGENPAYAQVPIRVVYEEREPALADQYDYYKVPTFFLGQEKLHEGAATKEAIRQVLEQAIA